MRFRGCPPKRVNSKVRMGVTRDEPHCDVIEGCPRDPARRIRSRGVGVEQQRDHHPRVVGNRPTRVLRLDNRLDSTQIELRYDVEDEIGEVPLRQPVTRPGGE